jgi:hypothetical protein
LLPPDDERLSLETCRGRKINTLKKVKKCVKSVVNPEFPQDAGSRKYKKKIKSFVATGLHKPDFKSRIVSFHVYNYVLFFRQKDFQPVNRF